jgi:type IV pilus assembly protein PilV
MSCCLICNSPLYVSPIGHVKAQAKCAVSAERGLGMLEYLLALLIFSTGMMGLMSAQLVAKKVGYEASQRSTATALGRDIVERMRTNSGQLEAYRALAIGDTTQLLPLPDVSCDISTCTVLQLAAFDLWQWESNLLGLSGQRNFASSGGLVSPRACISTDGGEVAVTISWLVSSVVQRPTPSTCGADDIGSEATPSESNDDTLQRRQLMISTYIGRR